MLLVSSHVDIDLVSSSEAGPDDHRYAGMIDGRTIQQYLELVAPVIAEFGTGVAARTSNSLVACANQLSESHLDYIAQIVSEECPTSNTLLTERSEMFPSDIHVVAATFFLRWAEAETSLLALESAVLQGCLPSAAVFAASVNKEHARRLNCSTSTVDTCIAPTALLSLLDNMTPIRLSQELVAYWYPLWRRSAFIFDSPFDYIPNPKALRDFLIKHS